MAAFYSSVDPRISFDEAVRQFAGFYYDLAISADPGVVSALRGLTSLDHILFACDWPFAPDPAVAANIKGFESLTLTPAERHAVERGNAARLFPRLLSI
jgi:predicted TIM-barrel fold metal-dependent hydrolase